MSESSNSKSIWDLAKGISTILIPILIATFGWFFSKQQHQVEIEKQYLDRVASLLEDLANKDSKKRALAITYMNHLAEKNQIDSTLAQSLAKVSLKFIYGDSTYDNVSAQIVKDNFEDVFKTDAVMKSISPRVFIHIQAEEQRKDAKIIKSELEQYGFTVPGIEKLEIVLSKNQLKYFRKREQAEADTIIAFIKRIPTISIDLHPVDLSDKYENSAKVRPRTFELWLKDEKTN